ncbi:two-component system response regulator [Pedobacter ginsenosidimutans]|uniref:Two-component system response regulator n=1 Tax=Pedobacter ginsenosidimutans TaxID=687842 RepID=A0A0T5VLA3_9SPHI|nr:LytTR family DNA-binding domain-containing protein [Pedobacter ginsenosidimutans]KRT14631.1 two-component system response regulator [Pedobacter ginsenosidimutans]
MKLRCIIIDDDTNSINGLKSYINAMPQLELVKIFTNPLEALVEVPTLKTIDIMFMDVDMPMINGIELAKSISQYAQKLIFTTSHGVYALDAFEVHAHDFLLKPYSIARFADAVNRLFPKTQVIQEHNIERNDGYFFVRSKKERNNLIRIRYDDIIYIESLQNYVRIQTLNEQVVTYISLTEMRNILEGYPDFIQIHRSFLISQKYIAKIEGNSIYMTDGSLLTIGKFYREQVMEYIRDRTLNITYRER